MYYSDFFPFWQWLSAVLRGDLGKYEAFYTSFSHGLAKRGKTSTVECGSQGSQEVFYVGVNSEN